MGTNTIAAPNIEGYSTLTDPRLEQLTTDHMVDWMHVLDQHFQEHIAAEIALQPHFTEVSTTPFGVLGNVELAIESKDDEFPGRYIFVFLARGAVFLYFEGDQVPPQELIEKRVLAVCTIVSDELKRLTRVE